MELERIYGVRDGSAGKRSLEPKNSAPTQSDLADFLGMSVDTLQNYKLLAEMIPETEELLDTGIVAPKTTSPSSAKWLMSMCVYVGIEMAAIENQKTRMDS